MPELRLFPLQEALEGDALKQVKRALSELGIKHLPENDDTIELDDSLGEDQLTDFLDRLDAHDIACDIYLPLEFEGVFEAGDHTLGSAHTLLEALEELRVELDIDEDEESDDEDEAELEVIDEQLTQAWHAFARAASACVARGVPFHVIQ